MLDSTRVKNENSNPIIQANTYFHVSLVNSGTTDKLTSTLNFTLSSQAQTSPAFDHLSTCDIIIGNDPVSNLLTKFTLKQLKIWSAALNNDEFMQWSLTNMMSQGYPNLVLYYRLDNDFFIGKIIKS